MSNPLYESDSTEAPTETKSKSTASTSSTTSTPQNKEETLLDRLKATIGEKVRRKDIYIQVPERDNVLLRISPNVSQAQVRKWRREAGEDSKNGMDATKFATFVIGHTTEGIIMGDKEVTDDEGYSITFGSDLMLSMTKTTKPVPDAVRAFFGLDPHVEAAALAILDAAGFGDTIEPAEDPTMKSSTN